MFILNRACGKVILFSVLIPGTKYDLDFKSPNKSGQNFKSGEDMINVYKELCTGICFTLLSQLILSTMITWSLWWFTKLCQLPFSCRLPYCIHWGSIWQGGLGACQGFFKSGNMPGLVYHSSLSSTTWMVCIPCFIFEMLAQGVHKILGQPNITFVSHLSDLNSTFNCCLTKSL